MNTPNRPGLRILVGAGSFADAVAALRIIERLPSDFCRGLGGVLVEEADTLATCQIPHQRVVLLSGSTALAPDPSQFRNLLRADARAFRQSLARAADPEGKEWVFAQDKGDLVSTSLRTAVGWDILVIGYRQVHKVPGNIVLMTEASAVSDDMNEAAGRLVRRLGVGPLVLSVRADDDTSGPPQTGAIPFETLADALRTLARINADAVLVDLRQGPIRTRDDLARLLEAARCPLIVFGASSTPSLIEHSTQIPPGPAGGGQTRDS